MAVQELEVDGRPLLRFDEAVPLERDFSCPLAAPGDLILQVPGWDDAEELRDASGRLRGRVVRRRSPITVAVRVSACVVEAPFPLMRISVRTENRTAGLAAGASRDEA